MIPSNNKHILMDMESIGSASNPNHYILKLSKRKKYHSTSKGVNPMYTPIYLN